MKQIIIAVAVVIVAGVSVSSIQAQGRVRGGQEGPPTLSKRGNRQIGSSALNHLGLRVGFPVSAFGEVSFSEAAAKADALGTGFLEASSSQKVSPELPKNLDFNLGPDELAKVKSRLAELRLQILAYRAGAIPTDASSRRRLFEFAKAVGIETIVTSAAPSDLSALDKLAAEFGLNVAFESSNPKSLLASLEGRSSRIGLSADIKTAEGLRMVNDRLLILNVPNAGTETERVLLELAKLNPVVAPPPPNCGNCAGPRVPVRPLFVTIGGGAVAIDAFEKAARRAEGYQVVQISKKTPITPAGSIPPLDRAMIQASVPREALVQPKKARKLLVIDLCPQGGFYHYTIAHANLALDLMAKSTGAFEAVFNNDLDNLKYPKIKEYDAVFLNSVVGSVFSDPDVIGGLTRFVREGGGVAAIHGSTYASTDVPEYGEMMGAQTGPHRVEVATLKVDDPNSPLTKQFEGRDVTHVDEFYHFLPNGPYSREKLHVLLSINMAKSDMSTPGQASRPDKDYGLAWIRSYGTGRVFNCALGHTPLLFATPKMAQMILAGIQFALGDLEADTTPSARLASKH